MKHCGRFCRRHSLTLILLAVGVGALALFMWAEYGYFCDQAKSHHETCGGYWSAEHMHDLIYNAASNWQSEILFGTVLIFVLRAQGARESSARE